MKFQLFLTFLFFAAFSTTAADVAFSNLTISDENQVLFSAEVEAPGYQTYVTALTANIGRTANEITQLTFYPERIDYLPSSGQLQIYNRFGLFRSNSDFEDIGPLEVFPSFENGADIRTGKINLVDMSPDGNYMIHFEVTGAAFGNLILTSLADNSVTTISSNVELNLNQLPVKWSPESDLFIYQKGGELYHFSVGQFENSRLLTEDLRNIGEGTMSSVRWGKTNDLYYLNGTLIYQILGVEFFTRSIYQEFLRIGRIVGKIPFPFDSNFDRFWISPDNSRVLLDKGGRNMYLYPLQTNEYAGAALTIELPYLYLPINVSVKKVFWPSSEILTIMVEGVFEGRRDSKLYRLDLSQQKDIYSFEKLDSPEFHNIFFSPSEELATILTPESAVIYNYADWQLKKRIRHNNPHHLIFVSDDEVLIAGGDIIELSSLNSNRRKFIAFSRSDSLGFSSSNGEILVQTGDIIQAYDPVSGRWFERNMFDNEPRTQVTANYRIYLENLGSTSGYRNMVMIRQIHAEISSPRTAGLFDPPAKTYASLSDNGEAQNSSTFSQGPSIPRREVSLVFNAINSVIGLNTILRILNEYNVEATFFINGDFIRHYPGAVREISRSKHEVGSLFNTYFNMADSRFQITSDFIRKGLIANEDDYFAVTGKELSLFWHAPYYYMSPEVITATENLNYTYISRAVDSLDWVPAYDDGGRSQFYYPSAQLIERIVEQKKPGSIISMTVGVTTDDRAGGGREDYLFQSLDVLINSLLEQGYIIVPISTLMGHVE